MKKLNNKGFGTLTVLLLILIVTMAISASYYAYQNQKKSVFSDVVSQGREQPIANDTLPQPSTSSTVTEVDKVIQVEPEDRDYAVAIPNGWKSEKIVSGIDTYKALSVTSPDFKRGGVDVMYIETGGEFLLTSTKTNLSLQQLRDELDTGGWYQADFSDATINGGPAIKSARCGHTNDGICYDFIKDGIHYKLAYYQPQSSVWGTGYKDKYINEFDEFVNSLEV